MNRRAFIKKSTLATGIALSPYILPSGRLYAATGQRLANHVVFCMFAGGVRNLEAIDKAEGYLMPNLLHGRGNISTSIAHDIFPLPTRIDPLKQYGTLFQKFKYAEGPTGHFNGHTTAITGRYTNTTLSRSTPPEFPTIFELYRKHSKNSGLNAWWLTYENSLYPILAYSQYPGYGPDYGANHFAATRFFAGENGLSLQNALQFEPEELSLSGEMTSFLNDIFSSGQLHLQQGTNHGDNTREGFLSFISDMFSYHSSGQIKDPWQVGNMNNDMLNIFYAEQLIQSFQPELLVVNMFGVDVCHNNFTGYCDSLYKADYAVSHLWNTIQSTPGMYNDTVLIVAPEVGRNLTPNYILDQNGKSAFDHTEDAARDIFCLIMGPDHIVKQNQVFHDTLGESIDIVPTIANILGFYPEVEGLLPGRFLNEAFLGG